jgi:two-component system phosphate regulon response regulator PhoB
MPANILIVDDEPAIREMVSFHLERHNYRCRSAADTEAAASEIRRQLPDLILLDWMLPGQSGIEFAKQLRADRLTREIPVILLTARAEEDDKVAGLGAGADDYITKPFSSKELIARIKAILRRAAPEKGETPVEIAGLRLDPATQEVHIGANLVPLGPTEFRLLRLFMTHPERIFSRQKIIDQVWSLQAVLDDRTVDVHIRRLRKALAAFGHEHLIQTVRGSGYRLSTESR